MYGVVRDIKIQSISEQLFRFLDQRTGFEIDIETEFKPEKLNIQLVDQIKSFFRDVGFYDSENNISIIRQKQLPYRRQLQEQQRSEGLIELIAFVQTHVAYYQNKSRYNFDSIVSVDDLAQLPVMSKKEIRSNFDCLLADNVDVSSKLKDEKYRLAHTSGTTGERLQVLSDMTLSRVPPNYKELWDLSITDDLPKTAVLTTPTCSGTECHLGKSSMEDRTRDNSLLFLNSTTDLFNITDDEVRSVFKEMNEFKPHFILCNPFYLHWYARRAKQLELTFPKIDLIWSSYQYLSAIQKRELEKFFKVPVYNFYTATELSGCSLSSECRYGHWHVREDHSLVEIDALTGRDDVGDILVTNHHSRLMPLLRYRVGDLAKFTDIDCPCELSNWQTIEYHGRTKDRLFLDRTWITTREFDQIIAAQLEVDFYACRQLLDKTVELEVICKPNCMLNKQELGEKILNVFNFKQLKINQVNHLKSEASLKFRLTGSELVEAVSDA